MDNITLNCCCLENKNCLNSGVTVKVDIEGNLGDDLLNERVNFILRCSFCNGKLKVLGREVFGGFLKITSSSPDVKREVLKKRSRQHFKAKIKERQSEIIRKTDSKFLNS